MSDPTNLDEVRKWRCTFCEHLNRSDQPQCFGCGGERDQIALKALAKIITTPKFSAPRLEVLHKKIMDLLMSEQNKITLAEGIGLLEIVKADLITQALEVL